MVARRHRTSYCSGAVAPILAEYHIAPLAIPSVRGTLAKSLTANIPQQLLRAHRLRCPVNTADRDSGKLDSDYRHCICSHPVRDNQRHSTYADDWIVAYIALFASTRRSTRGHAFLAENVAEPIVASLPGRFPLDKSVRGQVVEMLSYIPSPVSRAGL